jgi:hypothetical protein
VTVPPLQKLGALALAAVALGISGHELRDGVGFRKQPIVGEPTAVASVSIALANDGVPGAGDGASPVLRHRYGPDRASMAFEGLQRAALENSRP